MQAGILNVQCESVPVRLVLLIEPGLKALFPDPPHPIRPFHYPTAQVRDLSGTQEWALGVPISSVHASLVPLPMASAGF